MLRRRHEAMNGPSTPPTFAERSRDQDRDFPASARCPAVVRTTPALHPQTCRARATAQGSSPQWLPSQHGPAASLMNELQSMKEMIEDRFNTSWLGQKANPSSPT